MSVENIWENIEPDKDGKYYHPDDKKVLGNNFNLKFVPEPRLGNIESKILILSGNPNISEDTKITPKERLCSLKNHNSPHLCITHINDDWWKRRFKYWIKIMIDKTSINCETNAYQILSENICSLEYYPYSSPKFPLKKIELPSHCYQKAIIMKAIENQASIIITRARVNWFYLVDDLVGYENLYLLSSERAAMFSSNNIFTKEEFLLKFDKTPEDIKMLRGKNQTPLLKILSKADLI